MSKTKIISFILTAEDIESNLVNEFDTATFEAKNYRHDISEEEACQAVRDADLLIVGYNRPPLTRKILESAENVKLIQYGSTGYDSIDLEAATELGIPVANNPGTALSSVAEGAVMLMLMVLKKARENERHEDVRWKERHELRGKTLGILGLGLIGKEVARLAIGFRVKLLYHQRNRLPEEEEKDLAVSYRSFEDLLQESDILSLNVPLTDETRGIIGKEEIAKMKNGAVIVNTARKEVVDEQAVFEALENGKLFGFGTDFTPDRPFSELDVFMTPHISAITVESFIRAKAQLFENVSKYLRGEKPQFIVNNVKW